MRELAQHILDLVENSVAAGASRVEISIETRRPEDLLLIRVSDDGRGMSAETVARVTDPFFTSRSCRRVGLGLPLLKASTERSGGWLRIRSDEGSGTIVEATYRLSNVDTPPLGDLKGTVVCAIIGHQGVDVRFRQTDGGKLFELDSAEVKEILGDIPLTNPLALRWLEQTVAEGLDETATPAVRKEVTDAETYQP